eukprot:Phypoly_transcript_02271.p1 GENE.Phypoly_transcript_02271~~Phypoly_transcript_02271.p1  ORF type:complete len:829 (+),score=70.24 Phypoly_transcript_02271:346-2832(+)
MLLLPNCSIFPKLKYSTPMVHSKGTNIRFLKTLLLVLLSASPALCISSRKLIDTRFSSCDKDLFPVYPFPSPNNQTLRWPIGFIGSGEFNQSARFSLMKFAVVYVNRLATVIPNVSLDFYAANANGSRTNALLASMELINYHKIKSVVGSTTDSETDATAILANEFEVPQIASSVQSTSFSNMNVYPYFMRVIPSFAAQGQVVASIMEHFNWSRALLITTMDTYGTDAGEYLKAANVSFVQVPVSTSGSDFAMKLPEIKGYLRTTKVVLMFCSFDSGMQLLQLLFNHSLVNKNIAYIVSQAMTQPLLEDPSIRANYSRYLDGAIGLMPYGGEGQLYETVSTLWMNISGKGFPDAENPLNWYAFEAVYVQAMALDVLQRNGHSLQDLSGDQFFQALIQTQYTGVTGKVSFDAYGDRRGNWTVINFVNGSVQTRAKYIYGAALLPLGDFTFFGNSSLVPVENQTFNNTRIDTFHPTSVKRHGLRTGFAIAILICTAFTLGAAVILAVKWNEFQRHGPLYCAIIIFGVIIAYCAAATHLWDPTPRLCMIFPWLAAIAFDSVYGCLFIKTWVLYKVFRKANKFKKTTISPLHTLKILSGFLAIDIIFMLIWTFVDYPKVKAVVLMNYYVEERCSVNKPFWIVFIAIKGAWLLFGAVLSFMTRGISREYNESRSICYAIYHDACIALIGFALGYVLKDVPSGVTIVLVCAIVEVFTFTLVILFVPIWFHIFWGAEDHVFAISMQRVSKSPSRSYANSISSPRSETPVNSIASSPSSPSSSSPSFGSPISFSPSSLLSSCPDSSFLSSASSPPLPPAAPIDEPPSPPSSVPPSS